MNENTKGLTNLMIKFEFNYIPTELREYFNIF
jgi:hypothetical protein